MDYCRQPNARRNPDRKGTRLPVDLILNCLASGMTPDQIDEDYSNFPKDCIAEVLKFAAELAKNGSSRSLGEVLRELFSRNAYQ